MYSNVYSIYQIIFNDPINYSVICVQVANGFDFI